MMFMAMFILVIFDSVFKGRTRIILLFIFGFAIALSHYGTDILFGGVLLAAVLLMISVSSIRELFNYLIDRTRPRQRPLNSEIWVKKSRENAREIFVACTFVTALSLIYYYLVSGGALFFSILDQIIAIISPKGANIGSSSVVSSPIISNIFNINYILSILPPIMALIFITWTIITNNKYKFNYIYIYLALVMSLVTLAYPFFPSITAFIGEDRMVEFALMLTGPAIVMSVYVVLKSKRLTKWKVEQAVQRTMVIFVALSIGYLLVNTGLIGSLENTPVSFAMDPSKVARASFGDNEWVGAQWYSQKVGYNSLVYADAKEAYLTKMWVGTYNYFSGTTSIDNMNETSYGSYTFLSPLNEAGKLWINDPSAPRTIVYLISIQDSAFVHQVNNMSMIYSSGGVSIAYNNTQSR
jgi:hypothetical protein